MPRFACSVELEMEWGSERLRGRVRDASANGMFIESADPLWVGAGFRARLALDQPVQVDCFVRRSEPGRGMGVSVALAEDGPRQHYQQFVRRLARSEPG